MDDPSEDDLREDIRHTVAAMVAAGFRTLEDIQLAADDIASESDDAASLEAFAAEEIEAALKRHRQIEATWKGLTDCERLDQAFEELEHTGIVCRQDYSCCGNCGAAEIVSECDDIEQDGGRVRGYAFYHEQDTEGATEGRGLYLSYGAAEGSEAAALEIAREIVAVLQSHGLNTRWDGSWSKRIAVTLEWRRRRFTCVTS